MNSQSSNSKSMAMHQPNYLPWLGYFYKMQHADVFVYLDSVQYPRGRNLAARNRIKTPNGPQYLTVPVTLSKDGDGMASYNDAMFADGKWKSKHLRTLQMNYRKAPFFDEVFALIEPVIEGAERLVDLNIDLIETVANYLDIPGQRIRLSRLLKDPGQKSQLIVDICKQTSADIYLSGTGGGKDYNDEVLLGEHGIRLAYSDFEEVAYTQLWGEFEPRLSAVDALFNLGADAAALLR